MPPGNPLLDGMCDDGNHVACVPQGASGELGGVEPWIRSAATPGRWSGEGFINPAWRVTVQAGNSLLMLCLLTLACRKRTVGTAEQETRECMPEGS